MQYLAKIMRKLERTPHTKPEDVFLELPFGEQILLWGIRIWVCSYKNNSNAQNVLRLSFANVGIPSAHTELDAMMGIITVAGYGILDVRCPSCVKISADEMRLMAAIAAWQHGISQHDGDIYLECWARPATLRILRTPARLLAKSLKKGGLLIRPRPWSLSPLLPNRQSASIRLQSDTIH
jgi:hypothetical protein